MRWVAILVALTGCESIFPLVGPGGPIADTGNEDSDPRNNAVDNCPGLTNDQDDTDLDGVGNACDPHADNAGDSIVSGEFFNGSSSSWSFLGATWELDGAGAIQTTGAADDVDAVLSATATIQAPTLELAFTAVDFGAPSSPNANELRVGLAIENSSVECVFTGGMGPLMSMFVSVNGSSGNGQGVPITTGGVHLLRVGIDVDRATCTLDGLTSTRPGPYPLPMLARPTSSSIRIKGTALLVNYIVIYDFTAAP